MMDDGMRKTSLSLLVLSFVRLVDRATGDSDDRCVIAAG